MDETKIVQLISVLREQGVMFEQGLTDREVANIELLGAFQFPPDLRSFLQHAVPIAYSRKSSLDGDVMIDDLFPNWHQDPKTILQNHQARIISAFHFDVEKNSFWMKALGKRPEKLKDALSLVERYLATVPRLIPVYGHRYLPASPVVAGNPILSMWQALDTVYYGYNLEVYLHNEFLLASDQHIYGQPSDYRHIPFWSEIVINESE